ncbi:MAG: hypothetical protein A2896_01635 [Candidatus Nealsonbacteria bacterium RIFCSPLOWO2_01_FULL_43_32]|uniref:Glycosyl transferase family 1 domain-containing protein n=1 Tax=Candidatus Nealsonbacteria bacterium RIFCSPLOWO2_01_FULL_43_32 TaxID=1801672 RepID=A0A1G2EHY2_9BACT|nr:MAG: hypothetical protein A2896_01635 [Candidatus Nealsonbacteria bacterium RIFCSPLOWO2_01_FULL_43_32]
MGLWVETITFLFFVLLAMPFKKADLVYTRDKFFLPLSFFKKNFIFEAHTFPGHYLLYSLFLKRLKGIVAITQKLKESFIKRGIAPDKILVAPDGVDLDEFDIKESQDECRIKLGFLRDKKIVLYSGHLYGWKGAQTLAEASPYLPENAEVYFVGGTKEDVEKFKIKNEKLKINVVGHRPHSEIPFWLKSADVLVLPNSGQDEISQYWTSPMKLFEYMAAGRPIVASGLPSIREILNEENAVLVAPDNPQALAQGIKETLQNSEFSDKISNRAFQDVQQYTWQKRVEKILKGLRFL